MRTKYVKIERGEGFKNTYTTLKVALHALQAGTIQSYSPVTLKQIKADRMNEYREADYFRHIAEDQFVNKYNGLKCQGTIVSWHGSEGLIQLDGADLMLQTIYACNIKGARTWYPETACVSYAEGQVVDVELKVHSGFTLFVCGLTQGTFDSAKWNSLDQSKLAFRCDENGKALNGLFK